MTLTPLPPAGGGPTDIGAAGVFARALAGMRAELEQVSDTPTFGLSGRQLTELLTETIRMASMLGELQARLVAEADGRDHAAEQGYTSTTAWVKSIDGMSGTTAGRVTAQAR